MKTILILTASFGEGHNAAARGIRDGIRQVAPDIRVQVRDLFAETFGEVNQLICRSYLQLINRAPQVWAQMYQAIDRRREFRRPFRWLAPVRYALTQIIARDQPQVIVSVYPAYPHFLDEILGPARGSKPARVICITDSISINSVWFRCSADFFLVANEQSAAVLERAGVARESIKVLGFPVAPAFAVLPLARSTDPPWRMLYMINAGKFSGPVLAQKLAMVPETELTVAVGREQKSRRAIEHVRASSGKHFEIIGWADDLPQLLGRHHLLISKAGGATVQEAIAAKCPMIVNQIVPGQEEGNARLLEETGSGRVALSQEEVIRAIGDATRENGKLLKQWSTNTAKLSRPAAALEIAKFLLAL